MTADVVMPEIVRPESVDIMDIDRDEATNFLSLASRNEDTEVSGSIAPHILNFYTRWRWLITSLPRVLIPGEISPFTR
jgi:hypothetical protein